MKKIILLQSILLISILTGCGTSKTDKLKTAKTASPTEQTVETQSSEDTADEPEPNVDGVQMKSITAEHNSNDFVITGLNGVTITSADNRSFSIYNSKNHKVADAVLTFSDEPGYTPMTAETAQAEEDSNTSSQDDNTTKKSVLYSSYTAADVDKGNDQAPVVLIAEGEDTKNTKITFTVQYADTAVLNVTIGNALNYPEVRSNVSFSMDGFEPELPFIPGIGEKQ